MPLLMWAYPFLPLLHARLLPGRRPRPTDQDLEGFVAGGAKQGELGQVQTVWQAQGSPAAAEQGCEPLGGAVPRTIRVEDAVDRQRLRQCWETFRREVRAADSEGREAPAHRGQPVDRALHDVGSAPPDDVLQAEDGL